MRGLTPVTDQKRMRPHVRYETLELGGMILGSGGERTVAVKPTWTLGEVLVEPLFYNPNMAGWWGSGTYDTGEWEVDDRERRPECKYTRTSKAR
jgi:hypothetical protein